MTLASPFNKTYKAKAPESQPPNHQPAPPPWKPPPPPQERPVRRLQNLPLYLRLQKLYHRPLLQQTAPKIPLALAQANLPRHPRFPQKRLAVARVIKRAAQISPLS
jgi:hypothetical protein